MKIRKKRGMMIYVCLFDRNMLQIKLEEWSNYDPKSSSSDQNHSRSSELPFLQHENL